MFRYGPSHTAVLAADSVELGGLAWRFTTGGEVRSTPAVAEGLAVFGSNDGFLYAAEVKTGAEKWKVNLGGAVTSSPAIARGLVIVMGHDGRLQARKLADGSPVWTMATGPDLSLGDDPRMFDLWDSSPTVADDTVYVGGGDGKVYAVDLETGRERWSHATGSRVRSSPAVGEGTVYAGSFDGCVYALNAATGAESWKYQTGDVVQSSPALGEGLVFIGTRAEALLALEAKTGALKWRRPHSGSWVLASAAIAAGKVIVGGSDSHLLEALDAQTGEPAWSMPVGARMLGSPTVVGNVVLYGAEDFRVYTLDVVTGLGLSMEFTEGAVYSSVVPTGDFVLAGSDDHHLYAFKNRPAARQPDSASAELLRALEGRYRTDAGDVYSLLLHQGRLSVAFCTYPPALVIVQADGSFTCPMLWGTKGKLRRESGQPVSALLLSQFGQESVAKRLAGDVMPETRH
jgi:outer membrane protein assembly factor BamB